MTRTVSFTGARPSTAAAPSRDSTPTVRDGTYVERDIMAADELAVYEQLPNGSYGARSGCHDDILMTRAIGLHVVRETAHDRETLAGDADLRRFLRGR